MQSRCSCASKAMLEMDSDITSVSVRSHRRACSLIDGIIEASNVTEQRPNESFFLGKSNLRIRTRAKLKLRIGQ